MLMEDYMKDAGKMVLEWDGVGESCQMVTVMKESG